MCVLISTKCLMYPYIHMSIYPYILYISICPLYINISIWIYIHISFIRVYPLTYLVKQPWITSMGTVWQQYVCWTWTRPHSLDTTAIPCVTCARICTTANNKSGTQFFYKISKRNTSFVPILQFYCY